MSTSISVDFRTCIGDRHHDLVPSKQPAAPELRDLLPAALYGEPEERPGPRPPQAQLAGLGGLDAEGHGRAGPVGLAVVPKALEAEDGRARGHLEGGFMSISYMRDGGICAKEDGGFKWITALFEALSDGISTSGLDFGAPGSPKSSR